MSRLFLSSLLIALLALTAHVASAQETPGEKGPPAPRSKLFDPDADDKPQTKPAEPVKPKPRVVNLLALLDPPKEAASGTWTKTAEGELLSSMDPRSWIEIAYRAPEEYDFVVEFTRLEGDSGIAQMCAYGYAKFSWLLCGKNGTRSCFSNVDKASWGNPTDVDTNGLVVTGKRHRSVVSVRKDGLTASLDGRELSRIATDYRSLSPSPSFPGVDPGRVGVGTHRAAIRFHRIELVEITGRGKKVERHRVEAQPSPTPPAPETIKTPPSTPAPTPPPTPPEPVPSPPADGRGLKAEIFAGTRFQRLLKTRYDTELDFLWGDGAPEAGLPIDRFSVRWTGFLRPPDPGVYKLAFHSDDGAKVWLDERLILEGRDRQEVNIDLGNRPHALCVEHSEDGGWGYISLHWLPPRATAETVIPPEAFYVDLESATRARFGRVGTRTPALPKGTGVQLEVFAGERFQKPLGRRTERQIDWVGDHAALGIGWPADHFSSRWTTWLKAPKPGAYKLTVLSDDGVRLWLDKRLLIDDWVTGVRQQSVLVNLSNHRHALVIEHHDVAEQSHISLHWEQLGGFAETIVPPEAFFTDDKEPSPTASVKPPPTSAPSRPTTAPARVVNLLPLFDPLKGPLIGTWKRNDAGELLSSTETHVWIESPYRVPEEYDFIIEFTRKEGSNEVVQLLAYGDKRFDWMLGGKGGTRSCISSINGKSWRNVTDISTEGLLAVGKRQRCVVSIRKHSATMFLDGRELVRWDTDYTDATPSPSTPGQGVGHLGVGSNQTATVFHKIEVVEVSGRGEVEQSAPPAPAAAAAAASAPPAGPDIIKPGDEMARALPPIVPPDGRGLRAEIFSDTEFKQLVRTRVDPDIDFFFRDATPDPVVTSDGFSVRWTGYFRPSVAGNYRLRCFADDDVKIWLGTKQVLDNHDASTVDLRFERVPYKMRVEYVERGGPGHITLQWRREDRPVFSVVPADMYFVDEASALKAGRTPTRIGPPNGHGVHTEMFAGRDLKRALGVRTDWQISFVLGDAAFDPFFDERTTDEFSVQFTSWLRPPRAGTYKLKLLSDDGARLWIDGKQVIDHWDRLGISSAIVELNDQPHAVKVEWFDGGGNADVSLHWEQVGGFGEQIIPPEAWFTDKAKAQAAIKR